MMLRLVFLLVIQAINLGAVYLVITSGWSGADTEVERLMWMAGYCMVGSAGMSSDLWRAIDKLREKVK